MMDFKLILVTVFKQDRTDRLYVETDKMNVWAQTEKLF